MAPRRAYKGDPTTAQAIWQSGGMAGELSDGRMAV